MTGSPTERNTTVPSPAPAVEPATFEDAWAEADDIWLAAQADKALPSPGKVIDDE